MLHGVKPRKYKDHRKYSFTRTFGGTGIPFAENFSVDAGFGIPDQNADGFFFACTGYAQAELCTDQDNIQYDPRFIYDNTLKMEGAQEGVGCSIDDSLSTLIKIGARPKGTTEDGSAHKRAAYFEVDEGNGLDHFDAIRNALVYGKVYFNEARAVSWGSPWFNEWERVGADGIIPQTFAYDGNPNHYSWHNSVFVGFKTINGVPYLVNKSWQGTGIGDKGFLYFSRETVNAVMLIRGTQADTVTLHLPDKVSTLNLTWIQTVMSYWDNLIKLVL